MVDWRQQAFSCTSKNLEHKIIRFVTQGKDGARKNWGSKEKTVDEMR
jgi:hypothetical protein